MRKTAHILVQHTCTIVGFFILALAAAGCPDEAPEFNLDRDMQPDVAVEETSDRLQYDPPEINSIDPIELEPGGSEIVDLRVVVSDPDTPFENLVINAESSLHITATIEADELTLAAEAEWSGSESIGLTAEDPTGLTGEGTIQVVVTEPVVDDPAPLRSCQTVITYDTFHGTADTVAFASELNEWSATANPLSGPNDAGVFSLEVEFPPGEVAYKFVLDADNWILDPVNPYRLEVDGIANSLLLVEDCQKPLLAITELSTDLVTGTIGFSLDVYDSPDGVGIDLDSLEITINREPIDASSLDAHLSWIDGELTGLDAGRYTLRASIADRAGARSETLVVPIWLEEEPFDWADAVIYFAFTDRFRNGDTSNDLPQAGLTSIVDWNGGDYAGLTAAIEEGYFDELEVNVLWISPPNDNPDSTVIGSDGRDYTAYHGYFPQQAQDVENHFGTLASLQALTSTAHEHGIRVLVDFVANHVYETHPYYTGRGSDDEFNPEVSCRPSWDQPITCWFEPYLPDFNYELRSNVDRMVDDAIWWIDQADLDGFRLDAVKHMNHNLGYLLRARVDRYQGEFGPHFFMIGETFTGDWSDDSANILAEYVSAGELSGQFNFPLYWQIVRAIARREGPVSEIDHVVSSSEWRYPEDAYMGTFIGNHDLPRFISHANGDIADIWGNGTRDQSFNDPPPQPTDLDPYRRLRLGFALMMTLPPPPVIYYGDEIGLAGAGDPDTRRMFPWGVQRNEGQELVLDALTSLGSLRRDHVELRRGERTTLLSGDFVYAFVRHLGDTMSIVVLNNAYQQQDVELDVAALLTDGVVLSNALGTETTTVSTGHIQVSVPQLDVQIWMTP